MLLSLIERLAETILPTKQSDFELLRSLHRPLPKADCDPIPSFAIQSLPTCRTTHMLRRLNLVEQSLAQLPKWIGAWPS
jgi:hypothetical protein